MVGRLWSLGHRKVKFAHLDSILIIDHDLFFTNHNLLSLHDNFLVVLKFSRYECRHFLALFVRSALRMDTTTVILDKSNASFFRRISFSICVEFLRKFLRKFG